MKYPEYIYHINAGQIVFVTATLFRLNEAQAKLGNAEYVKVAEGPVSEIRRLALSLNKDAENDSGN
jgi:hypothetical protein